jgi:leucyl/phenylalanyl-tRNA---protein transferase
MEKGKIIGCVSKFRTLPSPNWRRQGEVIRKRNFETHPHSFTHSLMYYWLDESLVFPPITEANRHGVLALGGDLSVERLLLAYGSGIFPWYNENEPIVWYSPNPRFVLFPEKLNVSKSMKQLLKKQTFHVTLDTNFRAVMKNCQQVKRDGQAGTWITEDMLEAYCTLHEKGYAHSVEVWQAGELVGGLYGVSLGRIFFGESMFAHVSNASKTGFITLVGELQKRGFELIDSQVHTAHLESLGAESIPRKQYIQLLKKAIEAGETMAGKWTTWLEPTPK